MRVSSSTPTTGVGRPGDKISGFRQVPPGGPRVQESKRPGFVQKAARLLSRTLNALTPHGVRAQPKIRQGLENTDRHVAKLLHVVSLRPGHTDEGRRIGIQSDREAIIRLVRGLDATMLPMVSRRGDTQDLLGTQAGVREFQESLGRNLGKMPKETFLALQMGLFNLDQLVPKDSPLHGHASLIQQAAAAEAARRQSPA